MINQNMNEEIIDTETQTMEEELEAVEEEIAVVEAQLEGTEETIVVEEEEEEDIVEEEDEEMNDAKKSDDKEILMEEEKTETEAIVAVEDVAEEEKKEKDQSDKETDISAKHQIYVGNISFETKGEDVQAYFETFGELNIFTLSQPRKSQNGDAANEKKKMHRGFAFIGYVDESIAKKVLEMKEHKVDDRELNLSVAKPKTTRFFVGGLDKGQTKDETLRAYFEKFGEITDLFNCRNKGFCFVTMVDNGKNIKEILAKGKHEIDGKLRDVGRAKRKSDPRKGGRRGGRGRGRGRGNFRGRGGWGMQAPWGAYGGWGAQQAYAQQFNPYSAYASYRPY